MRERITPPWASILTDGGRTRPRDRTDRDVDLLARFDHLIVMVPRTHGRSLLALTEAR